MTVPEIDLPEEVKRQVRAVQFAARKAVDDAIADCPDITGVQVDIRVGLRPINHLVTFTVENKD